MQGFVLAVLVTAYSLSNQLDINSASLDQIRELPVSQELARAIFERLKEYGRFSSIYELMQVEGMTSDKLEELKPLIYVSMPEQAEPRTRNVYRIQRLLASEEGPTASAVEDWQDLVLAPMNINHVRVDDLVRLEDVSLVDAVAVVKHLNSGQEIRSRYDLGNRVPGLSSHGYRNIRDFVSYEDIGRPGFGGNFRLSYALDPDWESEAAPGEYTSTLNTLDELDPAAFVRAGFDSSEVEAVREFFKARLEQEREFLSRLDNRARFRNRVRLRLGEHVRAGGWFERRFYDQVRIADFKGFVGAQDMGPVRRLFIGDFRATLGQGLVLDNTGELMARVHQRHEGLYNDLSENAGFGFRGAGAELGLGRLGLVGLFSMAKRDAILNPDSSVNWYIRTLPRYSCFRDKLGETDAGGSMRLDLSGLGFIPVGTRLALNGLYMEYDRVFRPDARYLDLPGDADELLDPNYLCLDTGRTRLFYGADMRTVVENVSLEAELAVKHKPTDSRVSLPAAYLVKARTQYEYLYLTALYRHYDLDYDNPYNRGYCEQLRFEDTGLENGYELFDPAYAALQDFPMPKAEQGFLLETRYQVSRQVTFTRAYVDVWRNLAWGVDNLRFQAEVEWRPAYPLRFRFKQKLQSKGLPKPTRSTRSLTSESSIRMIASLTDFDLLSAEVREARVYLTPNPVYGDKASMSGNFVAVQWEHNFSPDLSTELGVAAWLTRDMSQWIFEDTGIDFLEGDGVKWYAALSDRISDRLLLYVKARQKVSRFPRTALGESEGIHYQGSTEPVQDFMSITDDFNLALQVDVFW